MNSVLFLLKYFGSSSFWKITLLFKSFNEAMCFCLFFGGFGGVFNILTWLPAFKIPLTKCKSPVLLKHTALTMMFLPPRLTIETKHVFLTHYQIQVCRLSLFQLTTVPKHFSYFISNNRDRFSQVLIYEFPWSQFPWSAKGCFCILLTSPLFFQFWIILATVFLPKINLVAIYTNKYYVP